jgi:DNA gyrase subunit A
LSEEQVISILELRLQKLTAYGIGEIETEINKLSALIVEYNKILGSKKELYKLISGELLEIKTKFAVPRRTKITDAELNYSIEETIQKESVVISITNQGYIKRSPLTSLKQQKRGGVGKSNIVTRDEDFVVQIFTANTHTPFLFFSSEGLAFKIKAWKIPEGSTSSKGKSLFNILPLKNHQSISSIMPLPENESEWKKLFIVFVTANGNVRKNSLDDFENINANGKIAMKLETNDKIVGVKICRDDQDIMMSTKKGKCIRFMAKKLRLFKGRSSKGIRGIQLSDGDKVISLSVLDSPKIDSKTIKKDEKIKNGLNKFILSITENGYGKRTSFLEYRVTNRGGKGIIGIINSPRNGNVASTLVVEENDEIILSTDKGSVMRCAVKEIRSAGRNTQGVTIKKLNGSEKVVSAIKIEDNIN